MTEPTTDHGEQAWAAIRELFVTIKLLEERHGGSWPGADVVELLSGWFTGLGYDVDGPALQTVPPAPRAGVHLSREQVEQWAGPLTDEHFARLAAAIPNSSIPDAVSAIAHSLVVDDDDQDEAGPTFLPRTRSTGHVWCPYPGCGFDGTESEVDYHRASGIHNDQPQAGSNLGDRPRS